MQMLVDILPVFLLVFARMSGLFTTAPVIGSQNVHPLARVGGAATLAFIVSPLVPVDMAAVPAQALPFAGVLMKELLIGLLIGFTAMLVFNAVQIAGQIMDVQIGFGVANVVDPVTSAQVPTMGQYMFVVGMLLFLALDGHHLLITALVQSYDLVPLTSFAVSPAVADKFTSMVGEMFVVSVKVGAPVIGALFLAEVALGMVARTVPQMNVFLVGIPMKIALAFILVFATLPVFHLCIARAFDGMYRDLLELSRAMGPGG